MIFWNVSRSLYSFYEAVASQSYVPLFGIQINKVTDSANTERLRIILRYLFEGKSRERLFEYIDYDCTTSEELAFRSFLKSFPWHQRLQISDDTAQKMKFSIKDFFKKYDQIRSFLQIWSYLVKKFLMENFISCAVQWMDGETCLEEIKDVLFFCKRASLAVYNYCVNHDLIFVLGKCSKNWRHVRFAETTWNFFKYSPKWCHRFEDCVEQHNATFPKNKKVIKKNLKMFCERRLNIQVEKTDF